MNIENLKRASELFIQLNKIEKFSKDLNEARAVKFLRDGNALVNSVDEIFDNGINDLMEICITAFQIYLQRKKESILTEIENLN